MYGLTIRETWHGNPGNLTVLPKGVVVHLTPASNLPENSPIKYWANPSIASPWPPETAEWAYKVGVGLETDDVKIVSRIHERLEDRNAAPTTD